MEENRDRVPQTVEFLKSIGVKKIDVAHVQGVGRAEEEYPVNDPKDGLCGQCCYGSLTVSPQGDVFPCSIGRAFIVGNVRKNSLAEIANSETIRTLRRELKEYFTAKRMSGSAIHMSKRDPNDCSPNRHSYRLVEGVTVDYITGCSSGCDPDRGDFTTRDCSRTKNGFESPAEDRTGCGPEVLALENVEVTYGCECSPSWCSPASKPCSPKADFKSKPYETQRKRGL